MSLFRGEIAHICTVDEVFRIGDGLPRLPIEASFFQKLQRKFLLSKLIWDRNPRSSLLYRTEYELMVQRADHIAKHPLIIHPFSKFRSYHEVFMAVVFLVILTMIPLECSFNSALHSTEMYWTDSYENGSDTTDDLESCLIVICWVDMVITFFTGYQENKEIILEPKMIAKKYMRSVFFYCDLLSSLPISKNLITFGEKIIWHDVVNKVDLLRLLKVVRVYTMVVYIKRTAELFHIRSSMCKTLIFIVLFLWIMHWYTCFAFLLPQMRIFFVDGWLNDNSWIVNQAIAHKASGAQYVFTMYQTVAYFFCISLLSPDSKITPPWEEHALNIFVYVSGKIILGIVTVILLQMFMSANNLETKYNEVCNQVQSYMKRKKLPMEMQNRILDYYEYKYEKRFFKEATITDILSEKIKKEIKFHVCKKLVNTVSFFAELPMKVLEDILIEMEEEIFLPNDVIMRYGSVGDAMYFLASGTVSVLTASGKEVCQLHDGAYFGEISLVLKQKQRKSTIVAVEICELYRLDKKAFKKCFDKYPQLLKRLEAIAKIREELALFMEIDRKEAWAKD